LLFLLTFAETSAAFQHSLPLSFPMVNLIS
jgi:hypothetical protein